VLGGKQTERKGREAMQKENIPVRPKSSRNTPGSGLSDICLDDRTVSDIIQRKSGP
jgi:hypothetical protein